MKSIPIRGRLFNHVVVVQPVESNPGYNDFSVCERSSAVWIDLWADMQTKKPK
jgi:hypothetical protein